MSGGDFVFDVSKGFISMFHQNVDNATPTNACLVVLLLAASGLEADSALYSRQTVNDLVTAGTTRQSTNTGYYPKILTGADITFPAADFSNHRRDLDIPDPVWGTGTTGIANDGTGLIGKLVVAYMPDKTVAGGVSGVTGRTAMIPITAQSFDATPNGQPITATINSAGFARAQ